jgi:hypothetical protein
VTFVFRFLSPLVAAIWLWGTTGQGLLACPICLGITPQKPTLAEEYLRASDVVVAHAVGDGKTCTVDRVIKGNPALAGQKAALTVAVGVNGAVILSRESEKLSWKVHGSSGLHLQFFFRFVESLTVAEPATDAEWLQRLEQWRRFLGHADSRIARSAWSAWASAPYKIIRQLPFEPAKLRIWSADPSQAYAKPMWIVLLGVSGTMEDAGAIRGQLESAWSKNEAALIPSLLTARIEQEGAAGIRWLEQHYIQDRDRTLEEIKGAMIALGVQGTASEKLRPQVLKAWQTLRDERRPLSGLVARDLARWEEWGATEFYQTLLASGEPVLPETRRGIADYLKASEMVSTSRSGKQQAPLPDPR